MDISPEGLREMFKQRAAADEELRQQELSEFDDELEVIEADEPKPAARESRPARNVRKPKNEPKTEARLGSRPEAKPESRPAKPAEPAAALKQSQTSQLEHSAAAFARIEASLKTIDKGLDLKLDEDRKAREARYDREGEEMRALGAQIELNVVSALENTILKISKEQDRVAQLRQRALLMLGFLNLATVVIVGVLSILLR